MERALDSLPRTLTDAYDGVMKRIHSKKSGETEVALRTVLWIFNAARPLRMEELRELLAVHSGCNSVDEKYLLSPQSIIGPCESLIVFDKASGVVAFIHFSAKEYFLEKCTTILPSTLELAEACMAYFSLNMFELHGYQTDVVEDRRLGNYKAYGYVAQFWDLHVKHAQACPSLVYALLAFLECENKRFLMFEIIDYCRSRISFLNYLDHLTRCLWLMLQKFRSLTTLHVLARYGLDAVWRSALKEILTSNDGERYAFIL
jgi:hypothetical protein